MKKVSPFLWYDTQAEEAMRFYVSVFKGAKAGKVARYGDAGPGPKGSVMTATFDWDGIEFVCLNGGPQFKFTEAVSFVVHCKDQAEVDHYWDKLTSGGGKESMCGWLKDKYGLSWQIVPDVLLELMRGPKADKVMQAFMKMRKFDIATLEKAAA